MSGEIDLQSLDAYDYDLPKDQIAAAPVEPRDQSRLLVVHRKTGLLDHRGFKDLPEYLDSNDLMVVNNSRVFKARLLGRRLIEDKSGVLSEGGKTEFFLLEELKPRVWEGLFHASAQYKAGLRFRVPTPDGKGLTGVLIRGSFESPHGTVVAEFDRDPLESGAGQIPLPPYIERAPTAEDENSYQTVFAKVQGSAAAPTAGLHFTASVIERLKQKKVSWEEITLHVGLGTFRPVKENNLSKHLMHEERFEIAESVARSITQAKASGRRVLAVGTTSVRTLESAWESGSPGHVGHLRAGIGRTSIFIRPGFEFKVVDRMLTNFHLPRSTLLMLVCAFAGRDLTLRAYAEAIEKGYRFYSYGDTMLVL